MVFPIVTLKNNTAMDKATINNIVIFLKNSLINSGIDVDAIALFGSARTGRMHEDSDIDMIVISKSFEGKDIFERAAMTVKPELATQRKFTVPLDILKMSPQEYENSQQARFYKAEIVT
jgi:predicted nucleotidyltransferase